MGDESAESKSRSVVVEAALGFLDAASFCEVLSVIDAFLGQVFGLSSGSGNAASLITSAVPSHWMDANWWFGTGYTPMGKAFRDKGAGNCWTIPLT